VNETTKLVRPDRRVRWPPYGAALVLAFRLFLDFRHAGTVHPAEFTMPTADLATAR